MLQCTLYLGLQDVHTQSNMSTKKRLKKLKDHAEVFFTLLISQADPASQVVVADTLLIRAPVRASCQCNCILHVVGTKGLIPARVPYNDFGSRGGGGAGGGGAGGGGQN